MNAIIGPTGCGKTSLLDALAGRKNPKLLSGRVFLDGKLQSAKHRRYACGYVVQDNIAVNMLTVRENIAFSAALRLSDHQLHVCNRQMRVDSVIRELGLDAVADRILGTELVRGVSGGERKRTCIGIELVKDPLVLYLDEPTTGLDAYTAFSVMETLKRLADSGRTIVFSIHQSKYSIYRLFDRLTLLAGGQLVYHGPAGDHPLEYFAQFGYIIEGFDNPADFLLDILHGEVPITMTGETASEGVLRLQVVGENSAAEYAGATDTSTPLQANALSLRDVVTHCLIVLWQQSDMWQRCLTILDGIVERGQSMEQSDHKTVATGLEQMPMETLHRVSSANAVLQRVPPATDHVLTPRQPVPSSVSRRSASLPIQTRLMTCRRMDSPLREASPHLSQCSGNEPLQTDPLIDFIYTDDNVTSPNPCDSVDSNPSSTDHKLVSSDLEQTRCHRSNSDLTSTGHGSAVSACLPKRRSYAVSYCHQFWALTRRQFLSMIRDYRSLLMHFLIQLIIAVFLGTIYFNLDYSIKSGFQNRAGLFFFTCLQLMFINTSMLESFMKDRVIFLHETSSGFYGVSAYFLAKLVSEVLPTKTLPALLFLPITYLMAGLRRSWLAFGFWQLTITVFTVTASTIAFSISAMVTDFRIGSTLLSMLFVLMMITSGYMINVISLGAWIRWLRYLSIVRLSMNTLLINELTGVAFCDLPDGQFHPVNVSFNSINRILGLEKSMQPIGGAATGAYRCVPGETFLATQFIEYTSKWAVWKNQMGVLLIFVVALLNTYIYLRCMKRYK